MIVAIELASPARWVSIAQYYSTYGDFGRRRVSGAETWNSTRLRYRTRPMFRSDLEHSLYSRMWIWRGSDASASAVLGRPEFEEGKGRSGLLCQVLYSRTLDLERVRRGASR